MWVFEFYGLTGRAGWRYLWLTDQGKFNLVNLDYNDDKDDDDDNDDNNNDGDDDGDRDGDDNDGDDDDDDDGDCNNNDDDDNDADDDDDDDDDDDGDCNNSNDDDGDYDNNDDDTDNHRDASLRSWPHWCVFIGEYTLFDAFSPIVHTKTPENADKNFRKRYQKWSLLKTASFSKRSVSYVDIWKRELLKQCQKRVSVFGRFTVDDRRKRIKKYAFSNKKAFLWTGENKRKTLIGRKYFASVWLIRRRILLKEQALLWPGPNTFCSFYFGRWRM